VSWRSASTAAEGTANQLVRLDIDNPPPSSEIKVVGLWTANLYEAGSAVF